MSHPRRDFVRNLFALGALPSLFNSREAAAHTLDLLAEQTGAQGGHEIDPKAYDFWNGFLNAEADPIVGKGGQTRGGGGVNAENEMQPVFLHYGTDGFKNAAELDASKLIEKGDVQVSVNPSTFKMSEKDIDMMKKVQNAQVRVDVIQKQSILPMLEAMAYTLVAAIRVGEMEATALKTPTKPGAPSPTTKIPTVQAVNVNSDASWQKMQNIPLPAGEGRWTLNLEAQRKDSLFAQVLQVVIKQAGLFAPVVGLPGIALSALQSFNNLYGALHSQPISIMKSPPLRVFATQEAVEATGAPGSVSGILLQPGTYLLIPANQMPTDDELKKLTVAGGKIVPAGTKATDVTDAAEATLTNVTYASFDVEVKPMNFMGGAMPAKSSS